VREVLAPYEGEEGGAKLIRAARALDPDQTVGIKAELSSRRVPARPVGGARRVSLGRRGGTPARRVARRGVGCVAGGPLLAPGLPRWSGGRSRELPRPGPVMSTRPLLDVWAVEQRG
jgi:hypothetical protein